MRTRNQVPNPTPPSLKTSTPSSEFGVALRYQIYYPVRFSHVAPIIPAARLMEVYNKIVINMYLSVFF
jgi:hypothetical protein